MGAMTETLSSGAADVPIWSRRTLIAIVSALVIVASSDVLIYGHEPGIGLAILGVVVGAGILVANPGAKRTRPIVFPALLALLGILPLIEAASLTGFLCGLFGLSILALAVSGHLPRLFEDLPAVLVRFGVLAPVRLIGDGLQLLGETGSRRAGGGLVRLALVWIVPLGFALIFALLFVAANPVLEAGFHAIRLEVLLELLDPRRVILWGLVALIVWPLLVPRLLVWQGLAEMQGPVAPRAESLIFGTTAIRNSLVLFNLLFAVQSVMDLVYLWGGVRLPDGMGHADYAHRGAYPLIVTALLAAAFVLAAMRRGGAGEKSPLIRALVYLWIAQNVLLVVSSILRLELYVEEYALTELRLAAGLWMALVATGLVLIIARIALNRSNAWLVAANLATLGVTLYGVSVVDTRALIAWYDVEHSFELTGKGQHLDTYLMGDLGWSAMPAVDYLLSHAPASRDDPYRELRLMRGAQAELILLPQDWQSWTWRGERLRQYVVSHPYAPGA